MVAGYLAAERDLGRVAASADISTLAPTLIGAAHLLCTDADGTPEPAAVARGRRRGPGRRPATPMTSLEPLVACGNLPAPGICGR
jgi:hypothetical protein